MSERLFDALRRLVKELLRPTLYYGSYEYRVVDIVPSSGSGFLQLQPVRRKDLPSLDRVPMWAGVPGGEGDPQLGSSVLVRFVDGSPARPYVEAYEGVSTPGYLPTRAAVNASSHVDIGAGSTTVNVGNSTSTVNLAAAQGRVLRSGEQVLINASGPVTAGAGGSVFVTGSITLAVSNVLPGPPGTGFSEALA